MFKCGYYYGNLCQVLVEVVLQFIEVKGLIGFILFEVVKIVGVILVVVYRYFEGCDDLIVEVVC